MTCTARPIRKRFLFWEYPSFADHEFEMIRMEKLMWWTLTYQCKHCHSTYEVRFVEDDELCRRLGVRVCPPSSPNGGLIGWFKRDIAEFVKKHAIPVEKAGKP